MIVGTGVDIAEIQRIGALIDRHGMSFLSKVFTDAEIESCQSRPHAAQHFAARFAAKEAISKALGTGMGEGVTWKHIEILNDASGKPAVTLRGATRTRADALCVKRFHVSLSHSRAYAVAMVIAEDA